MSKSDQAKALDQRYGFTGIFTILKNILDLVNKVDVGTAIKALHDKILGNETVEGLVPKLMKEANKQIAGVQKELDGYLQKNAVLKAINEKIAALKTDLGLNDSDMIHVDIQPFRNWAFTGSTAAIVLLDFLIGGVVIFALNQSYQIAALLMLGAVIPAFLYAKAAPGFAISKRLKAEIEQANNLLKRIKNGNSLPEKQAYISEPEQALSIWMRPSKKALSHKYGVVTYDTTAGLWKINVNHAWSWVWLALGSIFSFIRIMPVLARPELYDDKVLIRQFVLLVIALVVNFAIFALERERRGETGLPDNLQRQINALLKSKQKAVKESPDKTKITVAEKKITRIQKDVANKLTAYNEDYDKEFSMIVEGASHYTEALGQYTAAYNNQYKKTLDAFYKEMRETDCGDPSFWQEQIPPPEIVANMHSSVGNVQSLKLDPNVFVFKIEKDDTETASETNN